MNETSVWVARLSQPSCVDNLEWRGSIGTCEDYENRGLCHDGRPLGDVASAVEHCCVCGRMGQREPCFIRNFNEIWAASAVRVAAEPTARRIRKLKGCVANPEDSGYDSHRFRYLVAHLMNSLVLFLEAWVMLFERLVFLSLCARACDAELSAESVYAAAMHRLANVVGSDFRFDNDPNLRPNVDLARGVCQSAQPLSLLLDDLAVWSVFVRSVADQCAATVLNIYFNAGPTFTGGSFFRCPEDFWQGGRRWNVLLTVLEGMGCRSRRCDLVEVGVFAGETSVFLLSKLPMLHVQGVDPYLAFEDQPNADENVYKEAAMAYAAYADRAVLHRNVSRGVAPLLQGKVDLVFIDGSHLYENVLDDLRVWEPKTIRMAGHDLSITGLPVARAVHEWAAGRLVHFLPDGVWFVDV